MAAIGKIRSWGPALVAVIALALFAFIAEEAFRSCDASRNDQRQQVGEVYGEKINVQEFQQLVDEFTEVVKLQQNTDNLSEDQLNWVKDNVWNVFVQSRIYEKEAKELGLTVTDEEMRNILKEGTNPMLMQTPFFNQQTGRFDVNALQKFLADYKSQTQSDQQVAQQYQTIYRYWTYIEKTLRMQTLAQKYESLLSHSLLSNPIEAKQAFADENEESTIRLAVFPYSSIEDAKVEPTQQELQAKYQEMKNYFYNGRMGIKQQEETRDVKYVDVVVEASAKDRAELNKLFADYKTQLATAENPDEVVRKSTSLVPFLGLPVLKEAFPYDIAQQMDSIAVGSVAGPFESKSDNTLNLIRLIAKQQLPDSVQFRQIQVGGATAEAAHKTADSIYTALKGGADFEQIAKKYGQTGDKNWMTTRQYQSAPSIDRDSKGYIESMFTMNAGELKNITLAQGNIILQVLDRRAFTTKYTAAVVKKTIDFSKETYSAAYNKFSAFVSANQKGEDIVANAAKSGYQVQDAKDLTTSLHYLANIRGTRDALKWLFEAEEGSVSPMYECGENNHLLVVVLDKVHEKGFRPADDPAVLDMLKAEVIKDKKAAELMAKANGVTSIEAAKAKGAVVVDSVAQVTFSAPVFVPLTSTGEAALSGAVAATAQGKFASAPVKGEGGVFLFQVEKKALRQGVKFDDKQQEAKLRQSYARRIMMQELYLKANVKDNRYLFF